MAPATKTTPTAPAPPATPDDDPAVIAARKAADEAGQTAARHRDDVAAAEAEVATLETSCDPDRVDDLVDAEARLDRARRAADLADHAATAAAGVVAEQLYQADELYADRIDEQRAELKAKADAAMRTFVECAVAERDLAHQLRARPLFSGALLNAIVHRHRAEWGDDMPDW